MKFHAWHSGDPTTGDYGDHAVVEIDHLLETDTSYLLFVKEQLQECFKHVWDAAKVHVVDEREWEALQKED